MRRERLSSVLGTHSVKSTTNLGSWNLPASRRWVAASCLFLFFALLAFSQTNVYLRNPSAGGSFRITNCTQATPTVCTTASAHGFSNGQVVAVYNVWGVWAANGLRKVAGVTSTTFSLTDINGVNINGVTGSAAFCDPPTNVGVCLNFQTTSHILSHGIHATVSALGTYTLKANPRVWLDGPGGTLTTAITDTSSTGRANTNNVPWNAVLNGVSLLETGNNYLNVLSASSGAQPQNLGFFVEAGYHWNALGGSTELTVAKWLIDNVEQILGGTFACNESINNCNRFDDNFYTVYYMPALAQLYSLLHATLNSTEITNFANKMLNGNNYATHGWNGQGSSCTNQWRGVGTGTLSTSGSSTTVTISGGSTSQFAAGSVLLANSGNNIVTIQSVTNSTTFVVTSAVSLSSAPFEISNAWASTDCGILWYFTFESLASLSDLNNYPTAGGIQAFADANITLSRLVAQLFLALALADDDPRAVELLAETYAYYYDNIFVPIEKNMWTGYSQSRPDYMDSTQGDAEMIAAAITNSVNSPPDLLSGVYLQRRAAVSYYAALPYNNAIPVFYGDPAQPSWGAENSLVSSTFPLGLYPTSTEAEFSNWWLRNQSGFWNAGTGNGLNFYGGWLNASIFIFMSPTATATDLATAPHQYLFRATDYGSAECPSSSSVLLYTCSSYKQYGQIVSRTGLKTSTDTLAFLFSADFYSNDHTTPVQAGELQIIKNSYLLGGDAQSNSAENYYSAQTGQNSIPEFGGSNSTERTENVDYFDTTILRWAGTDPTGDPNNNYTYALLELVCNYNVASIGGCPASSTTTQPMTRVQRHFLHFKKSGYQDYILTYDDWAASSGTTMRTYLHYPLNYNPGPGCSTVSSPGEGVTFSGDSSNTVTVQNTQGSGTLLTKILPPQEAARSIPMSITRTEPTLEGTAAHFAFQCVPGTEAAHQQRRPLRTSPSMSRSTAPVAQCRRSPNRQQPISA